MIISSNPSHLEIQGEMQESTTYSPSTSLRNMFNQVFADETRDMRDFAGYGTPTVADNITITEKDSALDIECNVQNTGNDTPVELVAQYSTSPPPATANYQNIGQTSSTGLTTGTLQGLSNGTQYYVAVLVYNDWNNSGNYPSQTGQATTDWDITNTESGTPESAQFSAPSISYSEIADFDNGLYVSISANGNQDSIDIRYRYNGGSWNTQSESQYDTHSGLGGGSPEICTTMDVFPQQNQNDTIEVEARSVGSGKADSPWSNTDTASYGDLAECPV